MEVNCGEKSLYTEIILLNCHLDVAVVFVFVVVEILHQPKEF